MNFNDINKSDMETKGSNNNSPKKPSPKDGLLDELESIKDLLIKSQDDIDTENIGTGDFTAEDLNSINDESFADLDDLDGDDFELDGLNIDIPILEDVVDHNNAEPLLANDTVALDNNLNASNNTEPPILDLETIFEDSVIETEVIDAELAIDSENLDIETPDFEDDNVEDVDLESIDLESIDLEDSYIEHTELANLTLNVQGQETSDLESSDLESSGQEPSAPETLNLDSLNLTELGTSIEIPTFNLSVANTDEDNTEETLEPNIDDAALSGAVDVSVPALDEGDALIFDDDPIADSSISHPLTHDNDFYDLASPGEAQNSAPDNNQYSSQFSTTEAPKQPDLAKPVNIDLLIQEIVDDYIPVIEDRLRQRLSQYSPEAIQQLAEKQRKS